MNKLTAIIFSTKYIPEFNEIAHRVDKIKVSSVEQAKCRAIEIRDLEERDIEQLIIK